MKKGIYYDDKRKSWYIHTSIKGKTCTIRGFNTKSEANENYDYAIEKWRREHNISSGSQYLNVLDEYFSYRSKIVRKESLRKDKAQFKYYSLMFSCDNLNTIFKDTRLKIIYENIINDEKFSSQKKMRLVLAFRDFSKFCYLSQYITQTTYNMVLMTFLPIKEDKHARKDKRIILNSHFEALLSEINKVNDNLYSLAIFVLYSCGLRISELLGLCYEDIDLESKKVIIKRQLQTNGEITTTLKTSNSYRQVPMNDDLYNYFKNNEQIQQEKCEICRKSTKNAKISSNDFEQMRVFPYSHTSFKRKLREYEAKANIPLYSCHEYRHNRCFELAKKCENMSDVVYCAKCMGHSVSVYLNTYCNHLDKSLEKKFF